jgi:putative ABC transport system ATP-binding protein
VLHGDAARADGVLTEDAATVAGAPMIVCRGLTKVYGAGESETVALRDLDLDIRAGEYLAIMGPSGSGKSTLMHILGALDTPTSGSYFLEGADVSELSELELAHLRKTRIGFVFQAFNLLPRATVLRNVTLPLVYAGVDRQERRERAAEMLTVAGLPESHWGHLSNQLSGGQIQRVAIARALITDPALILADEPTGNLDTATGELILEAFARLHERGHTVMLITHEQEVANHAQRVMRIQDGCVVSDVARPPASGVAAATLSEGTA